MNVCIYEKNDLQCENIGLGVLPDVINGRALLNLSYQNEVEFSYPVNGINFNLIQEGRKIKAKPAENILPQQYRIYRITEPMNGIVKIYAQHISYDLSGISVQPYDSGSAINATAAISNILNNAVISHDFTSLGSTVTGRKVLYSGTPRSIRSWLGTDEGGILDLYGGELIFDNYKIQHVPQIGSDNGVVLRYAKNITNFEKDRKIDTLYTHIYPYAIGGSGTYHEVTGKIIPITNAVSYGTPKILNLDLSREFERNEIITDSKLIAKAEDYATKNSLVSLNQNIKISFIALWQTEEYKNITYLERVSLGDTVKVIYEPYNTEVEARVVKTDYDIIREKYNSIEIGQVKTSITSTMAGVNKASIRQSIEQVTAKQNEVTAQMIEDQTALITGVNGGNIITHFDNNGHPYETLYLDTDSEQTATHILKINRNGIGFSSDGGKTYSTAWDLLGRFNGSFIRTGAIDADLITTGSLNANRITSGTLNADLIKAGTLSDTLGNMSLDLTNGYLTMNQSYGKSELTTAGLTFYSPRNEVLASMFNSAGGKGVITANIGLFGTRNYEKIKLSVENSKGLVQCEELAVTDHVNNNSYYLEALNPLKTSWGYSLQINSAEKGSFYINASDESVLKTKHIWVDNEEYTKTSITVNGLTYYVLCSGGHV